ncbi:succinate dehydrogenase assembly factor 2 [Rhodobacteraceae bacterium 2CG4]|uniref:FAD assembly factor SdhE n=1 Tax=Halovulum marinum TaxID=2662447 RepID=A0A6L5Z0Q4_9RHOB|nr:succinate dehydrogenase assembly factor 2 [Halovulum marinum]MSU89889.1 succinate dehydrogenase assembly factor 2 [Halovulum marinum]
MRAAPDLPPHRKRLLLRCWRRGTREMDLILGPYADARIQDMTADQLAAFEALLVENDQDLYAWITGQSPAPAALAAVLEPVRRFHGIG